VTERVAVEVVLPGVLAVDAEGARSVRVEVADGARLGDVLDALGQRYPRAARRIRDETGALRRHVNVYVGQDDVRVLLGVQTPVPDGGTVVVLPNIAGG
jgi:molybdopterin converting factor small subunit